MYGKDRPFFIDVIDELIGTDKANTEYRANFLIGDIDNSEYWLEELLLRMSFIRVAYLI